MNYTFKEKISLQVSIGLAVIMLFTQNAYGMHIMEGYLPLMHSLVWSGISLPFLVWGFISIKKIVAEKPKTLLLLAMMGAYAFVLSAMKIPSITGSSSHPTGTGLGAVLFGPAVMAVLGILVLLFQALLLAHGGLTTLGANVFSMAIAGPFASYAVYKLLLKFKINKFVCIGIACGVGDLFTYCITAVQLGIAHPSQVGGVMASIGKFMGIFAITQVPLAIIEGIVAAMVMMTLESIAKPELRELGFIKEA